MEEILSVIATALIICLIIGVFFIFGGDPDIYDILQEQVKSGNCLGVKNG